MDFKSFAKGVRELRMEHYPLTKFAELQRGVL